MTKVRYLDYRLTLESPAIVSVISGDPNSVTTLPYIPGSAVRGAVAAALGDPGTDKEKRAVFESLVLGDRMRYLNAYPVHEGYRCLPIPVSLRREKRDGSTGGVTLRVHDVSFYRDDWPEKVLTHVAEPFITLGKARLTRVQPRMNARIHHQRDREKGRAWKDVKDGRETAHGAVFALESLDAGQVFSGVVQLRGESDADLARLEDRIKGLVGDRILVGRSRRAGYGGMARLEWMEQRRREVEGVGVLMTDIEAGREFRVMTTSAGIIRHPDTGQIDPAAAAPQLRAALGGRAECVATRWTFETIGGFNRKWRLETPQVQAVAPGSVFVFAAMAEIPVSDCLAVEHTGMGERRNEGFGRLLFLGAPTETLAIYPPGDRAAGPVGAPPPDLVRTIEARILLTQARRKIEEAAAEFAEKVQAAETPLPSNSLIGRLRTPLRKGEGQGLNVLGDWLGGDETTRLKTPAMGQLDRCRVEKGGPSLCHWLRETVTTETIPSALGFQLLGHRYHIVSEQTAQQVLSREKASFAEGLIDAVLAHLARMNKEREGLFHEAEQTERGFPHAT